MVVEQEEQSVSENIYANVLGIVQGFSFNSFCKWHSASWKSEQIG